MDGHSRTYDITKLNTNLQHLKEQLKNLMATSAELIERNSLIDSGNRCEALTTNPAPKFELLLEDFLSSCNSIELSLRTMQESLIQGRASLTNLPISVSQLKCDNLDNRPEPIEPNTQVSYNQYLSAIRYQVDTAKAIRSILDDFVNQQQQQQQQQNQNTFNQRQQQQHHHHQQLQHSQNST